MKPRFTIYYYFLSWYLKLDIIAIVGLDDVNVVYGPYCGHTNEHTMNGLYYIDGQFLSRAFCTHKHRVSNKGIINYICGVLLEKQREMKHV